MKQLSLSSQINKFTDVASFMEEYELNEHDLIITCRYIYEPYFGQYDLPCRVIYQEDFGAGEPTSDMVVPMIEAAGNDYNRVIGIGGGTVMDIAKLFVLENKEPLLDLFQFKIPPKKKCPLLLVPSTCGTGSEVTNVVIVGFPELDTKLRIAYDELYADEAVLIPQLLEHLPREVFATSSIDALIHAIESSMSPLSTAFSKLFGHAAIGMIVGAYQKIEREGFDILPSLLDDFLTASCYAGIAFGKAGCGAVHAMSYPLSGKYHVTHGASNYCMLSPVLYKYAEKEGLSPLYGETMDVLAEALNCDPKEVPSVLDTLLGVIYPKKSMSEYGAVEADVEAFSDSCLTYQQAILAHDPVELTRDDMIAIYSSCL